MHFSRQFIAAKKEYCTYDKKVNAPYLRRSFEFNTIPDKTEITICGLGFYELYINGKNITKGFLSPYISNPDDILCYDNYDISDNIISGKNVIGIILGNGNQNCMGGQVWNFDKARWRSPPKVALSLEADGKILFEADNFFKTEDSPITFDDLRIGEHYDARLEISNWNTADFDDSKWCCAIETETPFGEPRLAKTEPIIVRNVLEPENIYKSRSCEGYIYDFGKNSAGKCILKINGEKGQKIDMYHGEIMENGNINFATSIFASASYDKNQADIYICSGKGEESYSPHFTYHGFRYVWIKGITEKQAQKSLLSFMEMNTKLDISGSFDCSDEISNKIQACTVQSSFNNFFHYPTDCPHREKNGWTADAALSAEQFLLNFNSSKPLEEWLVHIRKAQRKDGALPGVVPTAGYGFAWGNGPGWDIVLIELPYMIYKYTGNINVIKENSESIFKYIKYMRSRLDCDMLAHYGLGDWCQTSDGQKELPETPLAVTDTLVCLDLLKKAMIMFKILNETAKYDFTKLQYNKMRNAFRIHLIDNELTVSGKTQSGQAMALYYGAFEDCEKEKALNILLGMIKERGNHFWMGVLGAKVLFRVLSEMGKSELAFELITKDTWPSYGYLIRHGATTLWESIMCFEDDRNYPYKCKYDRLISMNHHFWGDVSAWYYKYIAGININPENDDIYRIVIKPHFIRKLNYAHAYHIMPYGKIDIKWQRENGKITVYVEIPEKAKATLIIGNKEYNLNKLKNEITVGDICQRRVTIPTNSDFIEETKIIIKKWGADAVRDCDGTKLPENARELADKVYNTYFVIRGDNEWAKANPDELQHMFLMSEYNLAESETLEIKLLKSYFDKQVKVDFKASPKKYWEVIDRTADKKIDTENWNVNEEKGTVIIYNTIFMHEYTVSFLALSIWDPIHMYNSLTNGWENERQLMYDPYYPKTQKYIKEHMQKWCEEHPEANVVRFTTFLYQFSLVFNEKGKEKYVDWFGYSMAVSPKMLDDFEKEYGYRLRAEDLIDKGYYNNTFRLPSKAYLDYMDFVEKFVSKTAKELVNTVHKNDKEAMMFLGDCWIGAEPYGKHFKNIGLDAVVGSVGGGVTVRMLSEIPHVKYREGRFLPYFFPDTFCEGNNPVPELDKNWLTARRAIMRKPLDRIGYGGYLSLAAKFPSFIDRVSEICEEFRTIYNAIDNKKPYCTLKVAVLNAWGKKRSWMSHMVAHELWYQQIYSYQGILEALSGLAVDTEFISFEDIKNCVPEDIDVIINAGDAGTAFSGGLYWTDERVITNIRKFIYNGGGFIGVGEPSAIEYNGRFFQLSDALGVDKEIGFSLSKDKYNIIKADGHFITKDITDAVDYGEDIKNIYAQDGTEILDIKFSNRFSRKVNVGEVKMAVNKYGKGRCFYIAGLPYSFQNSRLLYRAMVWCCGKEKDYYKAYSDNINTECNYYPDSGKYSVVNNSSGRQETEFYDINGKKQNIILNPMQIKWL